MVTTSAETASPSGTKQGGGRRKDRPVTTLDSHVDAPSTMQPGDAPFDTLDPTERASSVTPDKATAAMNGHGTVNAVVPLPEPEKPAGPKGEERIEKYEVPGPDGKLVTVKHNLDTGETEKD